MGGQQGWSQAVVGNLEARKEAEVESGEGSVGKMECECKKAQRRAGVQRCAGVRQAQRLSPLPAHHTVNACSKNVPGGARPSRERRGRPGDWTRDPTRADFGQGS